MHLLRERFSFCLALSLLLAVAVGCNLLSGDTDKANKLVDEGNTAIQDANKLASEAEQKYTEVFTDENINGFPDNRDQLKSKAQDTIDVLGKCAARYRDAAGKFEDAGKLNVDEKFKEYLGLIAQANRKQAEKIDAAQESAKFFLDSSITDSSALAQKIQSSGERVQKLLKEAKDLEAKAQKIREDNKDKFKS